MSLGRMLLLAGALLLVAGLLVLVSERMGGGSVPRLPGDVVYRKGNFTFYFPIATSIVLSLALTLLFWFFRGR